MKILALPMQQCSGYKELRGTTSNINTSQSLYAFESCHKKEQERAARHFLSVTFANCYHVTSIRVSSTRYGHLKKLVTMKIKIFCFSKSSTVKKCVSPTQPTGLMVVLQQNKIHLIKPFQYFGSEVANAHHALSPPCLLCHAPSSNFRLVLFKYSNTTFNSNFRTFE